MKLLISYDLSEPGRNYRELRDEIKTAKHWWHYLESVWIIDTEKTVEHWVDRLEKKLNDNDRLFVVNIGEKYEGRLPEKAWKWFEKLSSDVETA